MKGMRCCATLVAPILLLWASAGLCDEGSGGQGGAFLRIPVGARAAGMGNAFASISDDVTALYFNPGGLHQLRGLAFGGTYSVMSLDRQQYTAGIAYADEVVGTFAAMLSGFGVSDIDGRDSFGNPTGSFDDSELAIAVGYARSLAGIVGVGGAFKYLHHSLADNSANGMCFDVGLHSKIGLEYYSPLKSIRFGASAVNLGGSLEWDTDSSHEDDIPVTFRFGGAVDLEYEPVAGLLVAEGLKTQDEDMQFHGGAEVWFYRMLGVRAGLDDSDPQFGLSVRYQWILLHYAYCQDVLEEGATSKIEIQLKLGEEDDRAYRRGRGRHRRSRRRR